MILGAFSMKLRRPSFPALPDTVNRRVVVTCETPGQEYLQGGVLAPALPRPVQRRVVHEEVETAGLHVPPGLGQEPLVAAAQPRLAVHSTQTVIRSPVPA